MSRQLLKVIRSLAKKNPIILVTKLHVRAKTLLKEKKKERVGSFHNSQFLYPEFIQSL
jgi:hypothetical protein